MLNIKVFTFNPFQENTYIVFDETKECVIIDPGMHNSSEEESLRSFIEENELKPKLLLNTHCHLDHVFGNGYCMDKFNLGLKIHKADLPTLEFGSTAAAMYGVNFDGSPEPTEFFEDRDIIRFGNTELEVSHVPGHCPGHVVFIHHESKVIVGGDLLFQGSVGRVDLPGGNGAELDNSIRTKIYTLSDDYRILPGHGPETNVGFERKNNPFVSELASMT